ncbi:MAG: 50S ribosomal protein L13 [Candidatus Woesearchaeota archaeon]
MIIDANNLILGRLCAIVAKKALQGEEVIILNCDKAVVVGKKTDVFQRYKRKFDMGVPRKGPFIHRGADRLVRRTIRGMLPYKEQHGAEAFKRVMCYVGMPKVEGTIETIDAINVNNTNNLKYVTMKEISENLGFNYGKNDTSIRN